MSNLYNVPAEMRELPNWVLWKLTPVEGRTKPTKVPYQPNGYHASSTNPQTWVTFDEAFNAFQFGGYDGLGFVFTNTPYSGIDLDDARYLPTGEPNPNHASDYARQVRIYNEFNSYAERSPSGVGCHIIVRGKVPEGKKLASIELYPSGRFFTMTGNVARNIPINDYSELLQSLYKEMGGDPNPVSVVDKPSKIEDAQLIALALAHNSATFEPLHFNGYQPDPRYPSQSEADQAYMNILAYYTDSREQCIRLFKASKMYRSPPDKDKGYPARTARKAFDQKIMVDMSGMDEAWKQQRLTPVAPEPKFVVSNITYPPGLVGEIAQFIYDAAPRQVKEIALAAAIGLMAGVCGRGYNINGTGLNLYILVLAKTGRGKEAAAAGIDKLMNEVKKSVPTSTRFRGPGIINSGQALVKHLASTSNCFVSVLGEFGITIENISKPGANSAEKMLYQMLLDLYNKSGHGQTLQPSIYSNKEDTVGITESPAVSILGESTHKLFYKALNEDMISAGLLPRFLIIEYNGKREYLNENASNVYPAIPLIERFGNVIAHGETLQHAQRVQNIVVEPAAAQMLRNIDRKSTDDINEADNEVLSELWNRAHMKIMRLSALVAVGIDHLNPVVTVEHVEWARNLVEHDILALSSKFENGEIGQDSAEVRQNKDILRCLREFTTKTYDQLKGYGVVETEHKDSVVNNYFFNRRVAALSSFTNDPRGKSVAVSRAIKNLTDDGSLVELRGNDYAKYKTEGRLWKINPKINERYL